MITDWNEADTAIDLLATQIATWDLSVQLGVLIQASVACPIFSPANFQTSAGI